MLYRSAAAKLPRSRALYVNGRSLSEKLPSKHRSPAAPHDAGAKPSPDVSSGAQRLQHLLSATAMQEGESSITADDNDVAGTQLSTPS